MEPVPRIRPVARATSLAMLSLGVLSGLGGGCDDGPKPNLTRTVAASRSAAPAKRTTEDGYDVILAGKDSPAAAGAGAAVDRPDTEHWVRVPTSPDPHDGNFSLSDAVRGLPPDGPLVAEIRTDLGTLMCDLFAERAPRVVAQFIGVARGLRSVWDPRKGAWIRDQLYDDTAFHRVIPEYGVQAGDYLGDGHTELGYPFAAEGHETLRHDRAGRLTTANPGPRVSTAQFFITDGSVPHLDRKHAVFGQCYPESTVHRIARVPQTGGPHHRPLTPVGIDRVLIRRVPGGAARAKVTPPQTPPRGDPQQRPRGASPGPSEHRGPRPGRGPGR